MFLTARDDRLRELALEATPGPWHVCDSPEWHEDALPDQVICAEEHVAVALLADEWYEDEDGEPASADDAAYIAAASPDVLLGLLDRLAAVEAERDRLAAAVERVEALADEWTEDYPGPTAACNRTPNEWGADLRAVLSDAGDRDTSGGAQ